MEKTLQYIIQGINSLPPFASAILYTLLILFLFFYQISKNKNLQEYFFKILKKRTGKVVFRDLNYHNLFNKKSSLRTKIFGLRYTSKKKSAVFKKILLSELNIILSVAEVFRSTIDIKKTSTHTLCNFMCDKITQIINTHEKQVLEILNNEYDNAKALQLYDLLMNSEFGWRIARKSRLDRLFNYTNSYIRYSKIFYDNIERTDAFFNELLFYIEASICKTESIFKNFNGEFEQ